MSRNICVKISDDVYNLLKELVKTYGSQKNVIEQAVTRFKNKSDYDELDRDAFQKMQLEKELNMVLVNKKDFLYLIEGENSKVINECAGIMELQSISDKPIKGISINELVGLLQTLFINVLEWFDNIDIKPSILGTDANLILFVHSKTKKYSFFMSEYITKIFDWLGYQVLNKTVEETFITITVKNL